MPRSMSPQFRSSLTYAPHEVQEVLEMKIKEEEAEVEKHSTPVTRKLEEDMLARISGRANTVKVASLFSGAGGLDLGVKLAAVACKYGSDQAYELLKDKKKVRRSCR